MTKENLWPKKWNTYNKNAPEQTGPKTTNGTNMYLVWVNPPFENNRIYIAEFHNDVTSQLLGFKSRDTAHPTFNDIVTCWSELPPDPDDKK